MDNETGALPIRWDLVDEDAITQGADWIRYFALYYDDPDDLDEEGLPKEKLWDTTGMTAYMSVRPYFGGPGVFGSSTSNGEIVLGLVSPNNEYSGMIHLPAARTGSFTDWGLGVWDLVITDQYGHKVRLYEGRAALSRAVTT